jgi:hypothetical protein
MSELPKIKLNYQPVTGGPITNKLTAIFGWKITKLISFMFRRLHNSFAFRFPILFYKRWLTYLTTAQPLNKPSASFNYVVLCGANHYPFLKQVLFSVQKYFEKLPDLYVFIDFGTTDKTIKKIKLLYPADKLHIVSAEDCLKYHHESVQALKDFALKNPMGLKLAAILQILDLKKPILYADTDVLWLNDPTPEINLLINSELDMHMSYDYQPGYDFNLVNKKGLNLLKQKPYYCAGLMFINRISKESRALIDDLLPTVAAKPDHLSEQTIFAFLQKNIGVSKMSPERYFLDYADQYEIKASFKPEWIARHYIGPVRHLFWRDAYSRKMWVLTEKTK